jgi:hypothetical protein
MDENLFPAKVLAPLWLQLFIEMNRDSSASKLYDVVSGRGWINVPRMPGLIIVVGQPFAQSLRMHRHSSMHSLALSGPMDRGPASPRR